MIELSRETDGQEHFGEEYYSLMNPDFNFFDTMVEAECSGEQASALQDHVFARWIDLEEEVLWYGMLSDLAGDPLC